MQKLLMGRELVGNPDVIIAAQPTRGLDVNAVEAIHNLLITQRNRGSAIFLISEDLDELFSPVPTHNIPLFQSIAISPIF